MNTRVAIVAIGLAGLLSACTSPAPATGSAAAPAKSTSIASSCIKPKEIRNQTIVSNEEIRFEMRNGEVWTNRLHSCPGLKSQGGFSWDVHVSMVCSNEGLIHVLGDGAPCQLGEFTRLPPLTPPT